MPRSSFGACQHSTRPVSPRVGDLFVAKMPPKHKEKNTIRFLPFVDRIANINVDVIHRIGHRNEEENEEEVESYFYHALEKWTDLNCSQGWSEFRSEVKDVQTLAQLILLREKVVSSLLQHLEKKDPLTVQALLDMVVSLARDLRQEFYPFYPDFLSRIISFLSCKEAEVLEWSFHCLAYLFKFLWRCMVHNIEPVLSSLLPLLSSKRPKYINYFAADSFAFLARKVKDQTAFINLILGHLENQPEDAEGCGRLIFAWLRGVKGQLHSCAQNVLQILVKSLGNESVPTNHLENLLSHTLTHLAGEITPGCLNYFWDAVQTSLPCFYAEFSSGKHNTPDAVLKILKLVHQLCSHCDAIHVTSPKPLVDMLLSLYSSSSPLPDAVLLELSSITAILLMSSTVCLPQDRAVKITSKVLKTSPPQVILSFVKKVMGWSAVESLVLPSLLEIVARGLTSGQDDGLGLETLAQLIQYKVPSVYKTDDNEDIKIYKLNVASACNSVGCNPENISDSLLACIDFEDETNILRCVKEKIHVLHILPHLEPLQAPRAICTLRKLLNFLCQEIKSLSSRIVSFRDEISSDKNELEKNLSQHLLLFAASLEAAFRMRVHGVELQDFLSIDNLIETLLVPSSISSCQLSALHSMNLYLSSADLHSLENKDILSLSVYNSLKLNLAAPHHLVREMTCRVLTQLPVATEVHLVFKMCLDAERTQSSISDYRDKLQFLQKLSFEATQSSFIRHSDFQMAPLLFILGSFYVNFQLLWEPLQSLLTSYACGMSVDGFWPIFHQQLCLAIEQRDFLADHGRAPQLDISCSLVQDYYLTVSEVDDKPDYSHYRLLLWQASQQFPEICEMRNRDISTLFLAFMEREYYSSNADFASSWNIKKHDETDDCHNSDLEDSEEDEPMEENDTVDVQDNSPEAAEKLSNKSTSLTKSDTEEKPSARLLTKTLLAHLHLFSKMRNPRVMFKEQDLSQIYHDLLSNKNPDIQKAALECILTYKHKYLVPYTEHLFSLIDNKSFKNEVTKFRIDKDSGIIQEEHRPLLIPIIMKIVYSKMIAKTGMRTGGKAGAANRRALVLRFLAGCHEDEMLIFVKMAFRFFNKFLEDDLSAMVDSIQSAIDLKNVVPPKRLQSVVNLLSVVQERFGGLMGNRLLSLILQLLTCVGATVEGILRERDDIHAGFLGALRTLRSSCIEVLTQFFDRFEAYPWTSCEVDTVLRVFVFPSVSRLALEGVHSPTALMKLFIVWSQHPRYFILFGTYAPNTIDTNPLSAIMKLLLGLKTNQVVCTSIMEILENLLTLKDHRQLGEDDMEVDETYLEERAPPLEPSHVLPLDDEEISKLNLPEQANLGSKLLFPHISSILERFRIRLASNTKRGAGLNKRELLVLSCISEFVRAPDLSASLAQLLLPILTRRTATPHEDEEAVLKMMNTLSHLIRNVSDPHLYTRPLAPLFSCINGVAGRKMLVSLVNTIAESSAVIGESSKEEMDHLASLALNLNAYDKRWVEQPDFDKRLDAFKAVQSLADEGKLSIDLGVIVIHHCFSVIRCEKDMSLRDFATHCLRRVAPLLSNQNSHNETATKFIVDTTILSLIRNSISKESSETSHSEGVHLLGEMARECGNLHPVLRDLNLLTNKADIEVDFFENLQHLQLHRKTRALLRFCEVFENVERIPNPRTLTQFILPLVSQFICSEKYSGKNSLIDAAVKAIGVVCRLLPWHQYEAVLRYYLGRLRISSLYQKQLVRIVMNVLDAFHFDLSRAITGNGLKNEFKGKEDQSKSSDSTVQGVKEPQLPTKSAEESVSDDTIHLNESEIDKEQTIGDFVDQLDLQDDDDQETETNDESKIIEKVLLAVERQSVLCPSAAVRVIHTIKTSLLPQLHRALTARTLIESVHKVNKKQIRNTYHDRDAEEEEVLRVPMALAVVKLLQRLPEEMLTKNLPGVFVKLCTFLKSRLESVRRVTRETLQKVMVTLGPSYLSTLLQEMTTLLTRGFQVHVLIFSLHSVLVALKEVFSAGDIDNSLTYIIEVCKLDLFGEAAEEKEEIKITSKLHEAQSNKSYNTLFLTAQFVSENHLTNLLIPFKDVIQTAHSHKIVNRASECLRQIVLGLSENALISPSSLLIFAVGVASESIPALSLKQNKQEKTKKQKEIEARRRPDCFIIKEAPKQRIGITSTDAARVAARMNAHIFVEFGLRLIYFLLKHEKFKDAREDIRPLVDPLIPLFNSCLSSQHVKLSTISLQCLCWLLRMDLPSLRSHIAVITSAVFGLLHKFAAAGLSKGDNFDLVVAAFKAIAVLVRDVKYYTLNQDQLKALLLYAEQDLTDANKHATAFALLKAILSRKLTIPEMHDVMDKVATLSITSDMPHVRLQARLVFHQFLMDYPLGKKLEKHLSFYLSQLNYELQPGRESALEMVNSVISSFPVNILSEHSGLFLLMLGARLVNDDAPDCRKMVAQCINKMLSRLSKNERDRLFNICLVWFRDKQVSHRRLAAQLCGIFVLCEKDAFHNHLAELLPIVIAQFNPHENESRNEPGKFVKAPSALAVSQEEEKKHLVDSEKMRDHHVYQVLQLILKICVHCNPWLTDGDFSDHVYNLTEHAQSLLAHPHEWVRLSAAQILTHILTALDIDLLSKALTEKNTLDMDLENETNLTFFGLDSTSKLKSIILDHCAQFTPGIEVGQQLLLQIVKNLVIFADILKETKAEEASSDGNIISDGEKSKPLSFLWLVKRMRRIVNTEVVQAPKSTVMRTMVLNWTAAVVVKLGGENIRPVLHHLLAPVVREMSSDEPAPEGSSIAQLRTLSKEVGSLMKKTVGHEFFLKTQSRLQSQIATVRAERKRKRKLEVVAEPEKAAKRKIQKQAKKKELKKLRQVKMRGKKFKKKKEVSLEDD